MVKNDQVLQKAHQRATKQGTTLDALLRGFLESDSDGTEQYHQATARILELAKKSTVALGNSGHGRHFMSKSKLLRFAYSNVLVYNYRFFGLFREIVHNERNSKIRQSVVLVIKNPTTPLIRCTCDLLNKGDYEYSSNISSQKTRPGGQHTLSGATCRHDCCAHF